MGQIIMPRRRALFTGGAAAAESSWASWDQISQDTLSVDQNGDSVEDTYVVVADGGASENDIGRGVVTGADLVITQVGDIPAALLDGSYYYRPLDGLAHYYTIPDGLFNGLLQAQNTYVIIVKFYCTTAVKGAFGAFWVDTNLQVTVNSNPPETTLDDVDNASEAKSTADSLAIDTVYYFAIWTDGVTTYAGFTTTFPTKKSDFAVGKIVTFANLYDNFPAASFAGNNFLFSTGIKMEGRFYWMVISKVCLIDNAL